jgi:hypothetical protein
MNANRKSTMIVLLLALFLSFATLAVVQVDRPAGTTGTVAPVSARAAGIALDIYHAGEWGREPAGRTDAAALKIYHAGEWSSAAFDRNAAAMEIYHASERSK